MNFALAKEKQKKGSGNRGKDLQDNRRSHPPDTGTGGRLLDCADESDGNRDFLIFREV